MLLNKKSKGTEDKTKGKGGQGFKKSKKSKALSPPTKQKVTPDSKKMKKDENVNSNKNGFRTSVQMTQSIQAIKARDKQGNKGNVSKRYITNQNKNKLLTTSPVVQDKRKSNQKQRSHDKSKSRSISKCNTFRSNNQREKYFLKSVSRKLYAHTKQANRQNSHSKSKSKSKAKLNHSGKDMTPQKQNKQAKPFNVADRQIRFKKMQEQQLKKAIKKKVQNRMKGEVFFYPQTERTIQHNIIEPNFKSKKKVPQIKTEFSQRRGSFFDQNLLKRLEIGNHQPRMPQQCPFLHIKSSFQQKIDTKQQCFISSRSQIKSNEYSETEELKARQIYCFKKQQQNKWSKMLYQLQNLKKQERIPEKIDELIKQLNQNYSCLQQKADVLLKGEEQIGLYRSQQLELLQNSLKNNEQKDNEQELKIQRMRAFQIDSIDNVILSTNPQGGQNTEEVEKRQDKIAIFEIPEKQKIKNDNLQVNQFKKLNKINIGNDFFDFFQNKSAQKLKQQLFDEGTKIKGQRNSKIDNEIDEKNISDNNLLQQLDFFQKTSKLVEVISISQSAKNEFQAQLQEIRQAQNQYFNKIPVNEDFSPNIDQEIKVHQDQSSQSMLLRSIQNFSANPNAQNIANEIQHTLILEFCSNILRSKQILHNFLTTYSQMVDAQVINVEYGDQEFKPSVQSSNNFVMQIVNRLLNHFQINDQQLFMKQINIAFECKPIEILRFIRCVEEDLQSLSISSNEENAIIMPFLGLQKIEEFQTEVLRNQYYIPNYFSFNHSIYDFFNDVFDELRPFGAKGKSIFSLQLSHGIKSFAEAKKLINQKFQKGLSLRYYQQPIQQQKFSTQEGMFEIIYFTSLQVIDQIFQRQTIALFKLLSRN